MTTRTLLITVPGSGDSEACGDCPFLEASWHMGAPDGEVCTLSGRTVTPISAGLRHAACLDAERDASALRRCSCCGCFGIEHGEGAGQCTACECQGFDSEGYDRSRLREVHDHLTAHGLPALDRLDAEDVP